jgi:hypothetical protein
MAKVEKIKRPNSFVDVACDADSLNAFGMNLRDWVHGIQRGGVHSRAEFRKRISDEPPFCRERFDGGDIADAYLAAYAEWLADQAGITRPAWSSNPKRTADEPWFSTPLRGRLIAVTPASFRQRNLFTTPEAIFRARPGRPRVSAEQKREKAILRQRAYRKRISELVAKFRATLT